MSAAKSIAVACGLGLLFAWMESLFLHYGVAERLAIKGYSGASPVLLFLAVQSLTFLVMGILSMTRFSGRYRDSVPIAGCLFMLFLPAFLFVSGFLPAGPAAALSLSGLFFSAAGAALLLGRWGVMLSTLLPDDVAIVFGLSPLAASFFLRFFVFLGSPLILFAAPLCTLGILQRTAGPGSEESVMLAPLPDFPIWRLAVFLFCFYAANGFLLSLIPVLFPPSFPRADQVSDWVRSLSALGAALIFRFYPHANLRNFYRGAFPFIAAALFLLTFSPYRTLARFTLEGGLAFLDLYAWLLLVYFASRAGAGRGAVINLGIFIIVFAGTASHYHVLLHSAGAFLPDESNIASFALLGIFLLLLMLAIWDGREAPIRLGPDASSMIDPEGPYGESNCEAGERPADEIEKEQDMALRMKLMEFNLTRQETEIALLLLKGAKDLNICSLLYISRNTLKYHLRNIYRKTGSSNRRQLKSIFD